jgi:hypothetical protein
MKNSGLYIYMAVCMLLISTVKLSAQPLNWSALNKSNRHIIGTGIGMSYGLNYRLSYGYQVKNKFFPAVADVEYSFPSGNKLFDDFKVRMGGQIRWIGFHNFQFSTGIHGVFSRHGHDFVRLINFGSDFNGVAGYYRSKWFAAAEFGFDKAIATNFKHTEKYKEQYPGFANGWYKPATGGNFYYGLQGGFSLRKADIIAKVGKVITQDFKTTPTIPYYGELGCTFKF